MIQIEAPDFDPDIDEVLPISTTQLTNDPVTQGSVTPILKSAEKLIKGRTPAPWRMDRYPRSGPADPCGNSTPKQPAKRAKHTH